MRPALANAKLGEVIARINVINVADISHRRGETDSAMDIRRILGYLLNRFVKLRIPTNWEPAGGNDGAITICVGNVVRQMSDDVGLGIGSREIIEYVERAPKGSATNFVFVGRGMSNSGHTALFHDTLRYLGENYDGFSIRDVDVFAWVPTVESVGARTIIAFAAYSRTITGRMPSC
jgi:hypothetical protein